MRDVESEDADRPTPDPPNDQDRLIKAVAAANPRTVVVLKSEQYLPANTVGQNTGKVAGAVAPRVYVGFPKSAEVPASAGSLREGHPAAG